MTNEEFCLDLLWELETVSQDPFYHPEGNALYHSLQVFQIATEQTDDPTLWSAALFHDVGKIHGTKQHAQTGAELMQGILPTRAIWLIHHHMDLLTHPKRTRKQWAGHIRLLELENLRKWDLAGRSPHANVPSPEDAIALLLPHLQS